LDYEPRNELGVVFLFAAMAKRYGVRVERVQDTFPDCIAVQRATGKRIRIEFELLSRNFQLHRHDPRKCDWIVCWENNWPDAPKRPHIYELCRDYSKGFNVWIQALRAKWREDLGRDRPGWKWSVPRRAHQDDLLLVYRGRPDRAICDIFRLAGPVEFRQAGYREGKDYMGPLRRVCTLEAPLHLAALKAHPLLRDAGFVRADLQGRPKVSAYWHILHRMILERNPGLRRALRGFSADRVQ
jgi:hypothetical protein